MTDQILKDSRGLIIGRIKTAADGKQTIHDAQGLIRGRYDPKSNRTLDAHGLFYGNGNLLTSVL